MRLPPRLGLRHSCLFLVAALALAGCPDFSGYSLSNVSCTPMTCRALARNCDVVDDGCGGQINCGACDPPNTCGGGGMAGVCGCTAAMLDTCTPSGLAARCGRVVDACGIPVTCAGCSTGTCGGGGPNLCGSAACTPTTCPAQGKKCGQASDGCASTLDCGMCPSGQRCVANLCQCAPKDCPSQGKTCGLVSDGCGAMIDCGKCGGGQMCSNANTCMSSCTPKSCSALGKACGMTDDGCGNLIDCGNPCTAGQACVNNQCGMASACSGSSVCEPVCNTGCSTGLRCDVATTAPNTGVCIPPGTSNQTCSRSATTDSCPAQYTCAGFECGKLCRSDGDCNASVDGACCNSPVSIGSGSVLPSGYRVCSGMRPCVPVGSQAFSCSESGGGCVLAPCSGDGSATACINPFGSLSKGQSCSGINSCGPPTTCPDDSHVCETVCTLGGADCSGKTCTAIKLGGVTTTKYGVCR